MLNVLSSHPEASQRDLCVALDLDRSTVADLVARLQRRGLIERKLAATDRRRNVLRLTQEGESELVLLIPRVRVVDKILTSGLSPEDRRELMRLVSVVLGSSQAWNADADADE